MDNFVHGDLHPGNILVQCQKPLAAFPDSTSIPADRHGKTTLTDLWDTVVVSVRPDPCPVQLVLLDAGIVAQLSDYDLANFKAVFTAVVLHQVGRVGLSVQHLNHEALRKLSSLNIGGFCVYLLQKCDKAFIIIKVLISNQI